jgi:hypothetical protein
MKIRASARPKNGDPGELEKGKTSLANAVMNNVKLDHSGNFLVYYARPVE